MVSDLQRILDPCCGSRMFWFDKHNPDVVFGDIRRQTGIIYDGRDGRRALAVEPDQMMDITQLPFADASFNLVVFDPPHLNSAGPKSWQAAKYGKLPKEWRPLLENGFSECFRVLGDSGILIFKWNETHIPLREVLSLTTVAPLFGQTTTVNLKTHWIVFMKPLTISTHDVGVGPRPKAHSSEHCLVDEKGSLKKEGE